MNVRKVDISTNKYKLFLIFEDGGDWVMCMGGMCHGRGHFFSWSQEERQQKSLVFFYSVNILCLGQRALLRRIVVWYKENGRVYRTGHLLYFPSYFKGTVSRSRPNIFWACLDLSTAARFFLILEVPRLTIKGSHIRDFQVFFINLCPSSPWVSH